MSVCRTIGLSLASLMISVGAVAKSPETSSWYNSGNTWTTSCTLSHHHWHVHHARRARHWYAGVPSADAGGDPADAYLGPVRPIGQMEIGTAAWYNMVGARTASGEILDSVTATAAHRTLPLASYARVTNLDTGRSVIVKINDRGPWGRQFIIDLSPHAAAALDVIRPGVAAVIIEPVAVGPAPSEARPPTVAAFQGFGAGAVE